MQDLEFGPDLAGIRVLYANRLLTDDAVTLRELNLFSDTCIMCVSMPRLPNGSGGAPKATAPAAVSAAVAGDVSGAAAVEMPLAVPVPGGDGGDAAGGGALPAPVVPGAATVPLAAATAAVAAAAAVATAAAATVAAAANVGGGAEAVAEETVALSVKTLRGTCARIEVPANASFGHIKYR